MGILRKAATRYREGVFFRLISGGTKRLNQYYWIARGTRELSLGDVSAEFSVNSAASHHELSYLISTEHAVLDNFLTEVRPTDTVYDIGANLGVYAILAAKAGANSVAIEPYPPTVERLRSNIHRNDVDVTVLDFAIGDRDDTVQLQGADGAEIGCVSIAPSSTEAAFSVPQHQLDTIAGKAVPPPDILKIDVEGAEGLVLDGGKTTVPECRTVYIELHHENKYGSSVETYGYSERDVLETLQEYGFECTKISDRTHEGFIKATQPE